MVDCLVFGRAEIPEGAVEPAGVEPALDVVEDSSLQPGPRGQALSLMSSRLMVAKKLSATALSQHSPFLETDRITPLALARAV